MPREWTEQQRAEQAERARKNFGHDRKTPRQASVEITENPPAGRSAEVFIAENEGKIARTVEETKDTDGNPVKTTHTRPGTIFMYKPLPRGGYEPRLVSVSSIGLLLRNGWAENCPDCGRKHIDKAGKESADPNLCPAHPPVAVIVCPVCRVRIYDNMPFEAVVAEADADENVISPDDLTESTPEQRLVAARNLHMWVHHPRSAQERGVPQPPDAMRDTLTPVGAKQ
jgi:hypothetical protein